MLEETPIALREGRTCFFYVGLAGTIEAETRRQEKKEKLARLEMLAGFEELEG